MTALVMLVLAMVLVSPSIELDKAVSNEAAVPVTSDSDGTRLIVRAVAPRPVRGSVPVDFSASSALRC